MSWLKDRSLLLIMSLIAALGAYLFWFALGEYAFTVLPLIALYGYVVERPKLKKKKQP